MIIEGHCTVNRSDICSTATGSKVISRPTIIIFVGDTTTAVPSAVHSITARVTFSTDINI